MGLHIRVSSLFGLLYFGGGLLCQVRWLLKLDIFTKSDWEKVRSALGRGCAPLRTKFQPVARIVAKAEISQ